MSDPSDPTAGAGASITRYPGALRIAVIVPCYGVRDHVLQVLADVPRYVDAIYCVDDACPQNSGDHIEANVKDARIRVIRHAHNQGVGGAMVTGYRAALRDGAGILVKLDGDGQMDPALIGQFIAPILAGEADYTKGNRFYRPESLASMPPMRLYGNAMFSLMNKLSTGYWQTFDPNNGYTAIHARALDILPMEKLAKGYFFEADLLFRLSTIRAAVVDIPIDAVYGSETSNLKIRRVAIPMLTGHLRNFAKRLFYAYVLRDFSVASIEWIVGPILLLFGVLFGVLEWWRSSASGEVASAGTVMIAALPIIIGFQMLLSAINFDVQSVPRRAIHRHLDRNRTAVLDIADRTTRSPGTSIDGSS